VVSFNDSGSMSRSATLTPSASNVSAIAFPLPDPAPVTAALYPAWVMHGFSLDYWIVQMCSR
jgi:hypothetical protein